MIRHGAELAFAYAQATVPRLCLIMRKAFGGAYIVMDSRGIGNDICLAWPGAEVAVMGASGAVQILHRGLEPGARSDREQAYEQAYLNPWPVSERGLVDEVIDPADSRIALCSILDSSPRNGSSWWVESTTRGRNRAPDQGRRGLSRIRNDPEVHSTLIAVTDRA